MADWIEQVRSGDRRTLARSLTLAESGDQALLSALDSVYGDLPRPQRIGITGPPGAGKSTLTSSLIAAFRAQGARVGVVAIDPTSPFSGGALLGDRLRMARHALDAEVFVRSMATRGQFGGLSAGTEDACDLLALAGFDPLMVETVGVGQSEVDVAGLADTTLVVLTPAAGDSVQALKAGIMEIADVVVINKSDLEGAARLEEDVKEALELRPMPPPGAPCWKPPIVRTVATSEQGLEGLMGAIADHRAHLQRHGLLEGLHSRRQERRYEELAGQGLLARLHAQGAAAAAFEQHRRAVASGQLSPREAARRLIEQLAL